MKIIYTLIIASMIWFLTTISYGPQRPTLTVYPTSPIGVQDLPRGFVEPVTEPAPSRFSSEEVHCLQENIFFEAATELDAGRRAVASVTLNRVDSDKFPSTICGVVRHAKLNEHGVPKQCQFSWYCSRPPNSPDLSNEYVNRVWNEIGVLAEEMANGDGGDTINGSLFYHAIRITPSWDFNKLAIHGTIGEHIFYTAVD